MPRLAVADVLGGRRALRKEVSGFEDLQEAIRSGLPFATLAAVMEKLELSLNEAAAVLHIPERTMARRKRDKKFPPNESDRVLRLARVYAHATEVFATEDDARAWLKEANRALGGKRPLDLLDTDIGVQKVDAVLTRIQHGVYS